MLWGRHTSVGLTELTVGECACPQLMNEMRQKGLKPTKNTYLAALNAMAEVRAAFQATLILRRSASQHVAATRDVGTCQPTTRLSHRLPGCRAHHKETVRPPACTMPAQQLCDGSDKP
jgi:hypothetical protein